MYKFYPGISFSGLTLTSSFSNNVFLISSSDSNLPIINAFSWFNFSDETSFTSRLFKLVDNLFSALLLAFSCDLKRLTALRIVVLLIQLFVV